MSDVQQIEFTEEPFALIGPTPYYPGDRKSFPAAEASEYVRVGWAKDVATGEQGERVEGVAALSVASVVTLIA